jgi:hypothetical protein
MEQKGATQTMNWKDILKNEDFEWDDEYGTYVPVKDEYPELPLPEEEQEEEEVPLPSPYFPERVSKDGQTWYFLAKLGDYGTYTDTRRKKDDLSPLGNKLTLNIKQARELRI